MRNKHKLIIVFILFILVLVGVTGYYWWENKYYVTTDDARIDNTDSIIQVSPQMEGKIVEMDAQEGDYVHQGDIIARLSDQTLGSDQNLDLTAIKAPIDGTILQKTGHVGEEGIPGSPVYYMADLKKVYVTADVQETDLNKIKHGQPVDFTVDSFPGINFRGTVDGVKDATVSTFSLLPTQNTGGTFTKVTQRVSVKILINDLQGQKLLPGMSAVVKIHVK